MNINQKKAVIGYIKQMDQRGEIVKLIEPNADFSGGTIQYNTDKIQLHREISLLCDEEYVRAYLVTKLVKEYGYTFDKRVIELEKTYSIGRPSKKQARVDLIVKYPDNWPEEKKRGDVFLFVECKAPNKFESDKDFLKGQLFDLSKQEDPKPEFAVYYTATFEKEQLFDRCLIVNLKEYPSWAEWDKDGQPANTIVPKKYGVPKNVEYAAIDVAEEYRRPLRTDVDRIEFDRLKRDLHDVIWGGGGTNNNDVFVMLVRLFLCRVYDELETPPGEAFQFQRAAYENGLLESPEDVVRKMTALFKEAAQTYLGYAKHEADEVVPFEGKKISPSKIAFVVEQLQDKSLIKNTHRGEGDLLGEFFEGIVSQDFTQTKGQFFTHVNLIKFCMKLSKFHSSVANTFLNERDPQGRPRIPKLIDPSCGSGAFMIEAMKEGADALASLRATTAFPPRLREYSNIWFGEGSPNSWAREFIYGIEPNSDLGLATKVNMILHGDGSTNVFTRSGLEQFKEYAIHDRSHGLAVTKMKPAGFPYQKECNEEFDFVFTNPPFSISLSGDEKKKLDENFELGSNSASENIFIERWYQLLRQRGQVVAVIPETVLDSSSSLNIRLFLFQYFKIKAVVSLPYVAFKPFTSTKTCILYAEKKTDDEVLRWSKSWKAKEGEYLSLLRAYRQSDESKRLSAAKCLLHMPESTLSLNEILVNYSSDLEQLVKDGSSWIFRNVVASDEDANYEIFLAEPRHVGYRRRKGLPDLVQPNDLMSADPQAKSVLGSYLRPGSSDLRFGFRVKLVDLAVRPSLRLDPKYIHLWVKRAGQVFDGVPKLTRLRSLLMPYPVAKLPKGPLDEPRLLVDLANVESKMSIASGIQEVDELGSDKIEFAECHIAISKLEPYLGKVLINDVTQAWIGTPEWLTYKVTSEVYSIDYLRFLLLTPEMLEVYRCIQSGKRHARMAESDFLALKIPVTDSATQEKIAKECAKKMALIMEKRSEISTLRAGIDAVVVDRSIKGNHA